MRFPGTWRRWLLVASLGLNLVALGIIAGAWIKGPPPAPPPMGPALWRYARDLPEPYRHDLARALRDSEKDWSGPRAAFRGQQQAMAAALTAQPFDPAAVKAVISGQIELARRLGTRASDLLVAQIVRMSEAERAAYAAALTRPRRGGGPQGERRDD